MILGAFVIYPLGKAIWLGHERCDVQGQELPLQRVGPVHRRARAATSSATPSRSTVKFALITVPIGLALGVGLAVLADKYVRGVGAFRAIFSSTVATSVAVASLMWLFLLEPSVGVLSNIGWVRHLFPVVKAPGLLRDPGTALGAVAASSVWASLGFTFILVTAGLQGIPRELHEAAMVDGAGGTRRFVEHHPAAARRRRCCSSRSCSRRAAFQAYGEIDLLTQGGPRPYQSTTTLTYLTYGSTSLIRNDQGLQAATAVLLFLVLLVLSGLQLRGLGRRVHYG